MIDWKAVAKASIRKNQVLMRKEKAMTILYIRSREELRNVQGELTHIRVERNLLRRVYQAAYYVIRGAAYSLGSVRHAFKELKEFDKEPWS